MATSGQSRRARAHPGATAGEIMSSPVITVAPGDSVGDVATTLRRGAVSAAPVVEDTGVVLGLVSTHDVAARRGRTAYDLMTTAVISISEDTPVADVRHLLVDRRIGRVLVLTRGRLVGILSLGDMAWLRATEWVCATCGEPVHGERAPARCLRCGAGSGQFAPQEQPPGS